MPGRRAAVDSETHFLEIVKQVKPVSEHFYRAAEREEGLGAEDEIPHTVLEGMLQEDSEPTELHELEYVVLVVAPVEVVVLGEVAAGVQDGAGCASVVAAGVS